MLTFVLFSLKRAWQGFWRNALMSLAATLTMVLMLLLLAGFFILQNVLLACRAVGLGASLTTLHRAFGRVDMQLLYLADPVSR